MKEYLSDLKFTLGLLFIIVCIILYNIGYFFSDETISSVKVIQLNTIDVDNNTSNLMKK